MLVASRSRVEMDPCPPINFFKFIYLSEPSQNALLCTSLWCIHTSYMRTTFVFTCSLQTIYFISSQAALSIFNAYQYVIRFNFCRKSLIERAYSRSLLSELPQQRSSSTQTTNVIFILVSAVLSFKRVVCWGLS